jgi:hypothetical protein
MLVHINRIVRCLMLMLMYVGNVDDAVVVELGRCCAMVEMGC